MADCSPTPARPGQEEPNLAGIRDDTEKRPQRQSLWQAVRRNLHGRCLCLSLLICLCISVTFWCQLEKINQILIGLRIVDERLFALDEESSCEDGFVFLPLVCLVSLYVGYLIECWHCTTRLVLMYRVESGNVYSYAEQMRQAQPIIWWKAACFHHVRHTRPVARYRNGSTYSNSQVFQERVTTHVSGSYFSYSSCGVKDISKQLTGLERYPTTRIYFSKGFAFANERSAAEFDEQRSTFFRSNERFDHYLEIREGLDLVGVNFQEYMIAVGDACHNPWYNNQFTFWLFSVALLSWPLRILLEYNTAYVNFQIVKLFGVNYGGSESPCQISRVSTMDTLSNCMIAPSYSEAMSLAERIYCLRSCSESLEDRDPSDQPKHGSQRVSLRYRFEEQASCSPRPGRTATKDCQPEPPSYEEVIQDSAVPLGSDMPARPSLKGYWNHLIGLLRANLSHSGSLPRSFTDKDFFQKLLAAQFMRKPCTSSSIGDISHNLITHV